jgi:hypothetical protein
MKYNFGQNLVEEDLDQEFDNLKSAIMGIAGELHMGYKAFDEAVEDEVIDEDGNPIQDETEADIAEQIYNDLTVDLEDDEVDDFAVQAALEAGEAIGDGLEEEGFKVALGQLIVKAGEAIAKSAIGKKAIAATNRVAQWLDSGDEFDNIAEYDPSKKVYTFEFFKETLGRQSDSFVRLTIRAMMNHDEIVAVKNEDGETVFQMPSMDAALEEEGKPDWGPLNAVKKKLEDYSKTLTDKASADFKTVMKDITADLMPDFDKLNEAGIYDGGNESVAELRDILADMEDEAEAKNEWDFADIIGDKLAEYGDEDDPEFGTYAGLPEFDAADILKELISQGEQMGYGQTLDEQSNGYMAVGHSVKVAREGFGSREVTDIAEYKDRSIFSQAVTPIDEGTTGKIHDNSNLQFPVIEVDGKLLMVNVDSLLDLDLTEEAYAATAAQSKLAGHRNLRGPVAEYLEQVKSKQGEEGAVAEMKALFKNVPDERISNLVRKGGQKEADKLLREFGIDGVAFKLKLKKLGGRFNKMLEKITGGRLKLNEAEAATTANMGSYVPDNKLSGRAEKRVRPEVQIEAVKNLADRTILEEARARKNDGTLTDNLTEVYGQVITTQKGKDALATLTEESEENLANKPKFSIVTDVKTGEVYVHKYNGEGMFNPQVWNSDFKDEFLKFEDFPFYIKMSDQVGRKQKNVETLQVTASLEGDKIAIVSEESGEVLYDLDVK